MGLPVKRSLTERTDAKLRYASVHLQELAEYEEQLDDWARAHVESVLFHLDGIFDCLLQEINEAYDIGLSTRKVSFHSLRSKLDRHQKQSSAFDYLERLVERGNWAYELRELRHQGTHRDGINRFIRVNLKKQEQSVRFISPVDNNVVEIDQADLIEQYSDRLQSLIQKVRIIISEDRALR